jgi:hypothetical protein
LLIGIHVDARNELSIFDRLAFDNLDSSAAQRNRAWSALENENNAPFHGFMSEMRFYPACMNQAEQK